MECPESVNQFVNFNCALFMSHGKIFSNAGLSAAYALKLRFVSLKTPKDKVVENKAISDYGQD